MGIKPLFPIPITDFTFILAPQTLQLSNDPICNKIELKFMDCLDAYGTLKARQKCPELLYDLIECSDHYAQRQRAKLMMQERMKQYREGKLSRPFEEYPYLDSYLSQSK